MDIGRTTLERKDPQLFNTVYSYMYLQHHAPLLSTFSTLQPLRQEVARDIARQGGPNKHVHLNVGSASFDSYEALSEKFSGSAGKKEGAIDADNILQARQKLVENGRVEIPATDVRRLDVGNGTPPALSYRPLTGSLKQRRPRQARKAGENGSQLVRRIKQDLTESQNSAVDETLEKRDWKGRMLQIGKEVHEMTRAQKVRESDGVTEKMRQRVDYTGLRLDPQEIAVRDPLPIPWALSSDEAKGMNARQVLDAEIARFAAWAEPTDAETAARQAVAKETQDFIMETLNEKNIMTEVFGSEATGLSLPTSDIDIRIIDGGRSEEEQKHYEFGPVMKYFYHKLLRNPAYITVVFRQAKYPIISAQHRATGLDIQIVSSPSTATQQALTRDFLATIPNLKPLYYLIRTILSTRGLLDVFYGGIGSYGSLILLIAALTRRSSSIPTTSADQLLHFFTFYNRFPTTTHALAVLPTSPPTTKPFLKHPTSTPTKHYIEAAHARHDPIRAGQWAIGQIKPLQPYLLCLQDPADPTNDLGRKSNAIKHLLKTLEFLGVGLRANMRSYDGIKGKWEHESLLEPRVGRVHEVWAERRRRLERYGRKVLDGEGTSGEVDVAETSNAEVKEEAKAVSAEA